MTKQVRIENACTAPYQVVVETWERGGDLQSDTLVSTQVLGYPTAMTNDLTYLTSTRYLVVKEVSLSTTP